MERVRITGAHPYLTAIQTWYEAAFPLAERRHFADLLPLLACPDMHLCALLDGKQLIGFIIYWHWTDVDALYIEHFVIDPARRGIGLGKQALALVMETQAAHYLLEAELPTSILNQRRIQFYEQQGFRVAPFSYSQPPYRRGNSPIPMHLLTRPTPVTQAECNRFSSLIKARVYDAFLH